MKVRERGEHEPCHRLQHRSNSTSSPLSAAPNVHRRAGGSTVTLDEFIQSAAALTLRLCINCFSPTALRTHQRVRVSTKRFMRRRVKRLDRAMTVKKLARGMH
jgi:hypothetical protein